MANPDSTMHAVDLERMLAENLRTREQIADRIRERIAALEGELPRLRGMLESLESCGTAPLKGAINKVRVDAYPAMEIGK